MMKRFYLMGLLVLGAMHSGMGQSRPGGQPSKLDRARLRAHPPVMQSTQVRPEPGRGGAPGGAGGSRLPVWGTEIGQTTYDLMSNRAVGQRLVQPAPGVLSAVWTQSCALTNGWPLRGIGYNYYANGSWANGTGTAGGCPSSFGIASFRTGWPEITVVNGEEVVFAHTDNPGVDGIVTTRRPLGTGAWAPTTRLPFTKDIGGAGSGNIGFWPRLASNGQTIHLLYCSNGSTTVGQLPSGIIGPTLYARSLDGGATWDQQNVHLPGMSNANFFSIGGDSYAIAANGNTVAVVAGGFGDHVVVWKSTDNGTTFTPRVIERVEDTDTIMIGSNIAAITSDGAFSITVDNGGKVHVWTGLTLASVQVDSVAGTGFKSAQRYFPLAIEGGLAYWNDAELAASEPVQIAGIEDWFAVTPGIGDTLAGGAIGYVGGRVSMPTSSYDATGNVYVIYAAQVRGTTSTGDDTGQPYRDLYVMKGMNMGGVTRWGAPVCISRVLRNVQPEGAAANGEESVFPASIRMVGPDNLLHYMWITDFEPGTSPGDDADPIVQNRILYDVLDVTTIPLSVPKAAASWAGSADVVPNPAEGQATLRLTLHRAAQVSVTVHDALGRPVRQLAAAHRSRGVHDVALDLHGLAPGVYACTVGGGSFALTRRFVVR